MLHYPKSNSECGTVMFVLYFLLPFLNIHFRTSVITFFAKITTWKQTVSPRGLFWLEDVAIIDLKEPLDYNLAPRGSTMDYLPLENSPLSLNAFPPLISNGEDRFAYGLVIRVGNYHK